MPLGANAPTPTPTATPRQRPRPPRRLRPRPRRRPRRPRPPRQPPRQPPRRLPRPTPTPTAPLPTGTPGAVPVGTATYPIPNGAATPHHPADDSASGDIASPVRTVARAVALAPSGGTVVLRAGRYHETITIQGKALTVQNYPGEAAWLDGSETVTGWVQDGSVWRRDGWTTRFDHSPTYARGAPDLTATGMAVRQSRATPWPPIPTRSSSMARRCSRWRREARSSPARSTSTSPRPSS